jgi:hypothetical protein
LSHAANQGAVCTQNKFLLMKISALRRFQKFESIFEQRHKLFMADKRAGFRCAAVFKLAKRRAWQPISLPFSHTPLSSLFLSVAAIGYCQTK